MSGFTLTGPTGRQKRWGEYTITRNIEGQTKDKVFNKDFVDPYKESQITLKRPKKYLTYEMIPVRELQGAGASFRGNLSAAKLATKGQGHKQNIINNCYVAVPIDLCASHEGCVTSMIDFKHDYDSTDYWPFTVTLGSERVVVYVMSNAPGVKCEDGRHRIALSRNLNGLYFTIGYELVIAKLLGGFQKMDRGGMASNIFRILSNGYVKVVYVTKSLVPEVLMALLWDAILSGLLIALTTFQNRGDVTVHPELENRHYFSLRGLICCRYKKKNTMAAIMHNPKGLPIKGTLHSKGVEHNDIDPAGQTMLIKSLKEQGTVAVRIEELFHRIDRIELCRPCLPAVPQRPNPIILETMGKDQEEWIFKGHLSPEDQSLPSHMALMPAGSLLIEVIAAQDWTGLEEFEKIGVDIYNACNGKIIDSVCEYGHSAVAFRSDEKLKLSVQLKLPGWKKIGYTLTILATKNPDPVISLPSDKEWCGSSTYKQEIGKGMLAEGSSPMSHSSSQGQNWPRGETVGSGREGLPEVSSSAARATPPPLLSPLLSASPLATAATTGSAQEGGATSASSAASEAAPAALIADSESNDSKVGLSCTSTSTMLLQSNSSDSSSKLLVQSASSALLQSRGLRPHLFGALGPRMQHLLHCSMGGSGASSGSSSKVQQLLTGLTSTDETVQLSAVIEMCQMLVMGNEDTLAGFPIKQVVPALINLLSMEHNFDMMNHACRALTYMMEALPRSSVVVVDAVPCFLEKLQVIQCMAVAEQSLTALEMLSRRHGKAILQARGVSSCLTYLDFFSINAQRAALATTANCCMNLHPDEFHLVSDSLPVLASRLIQQDKRSIESVCLAFSRLVDSFQLDATCLQTIASAELLANLQRILVVSPQIISTGTFITVLRMLSVMCVNCPSLASELLRHNVAESLAFLLTGNATNVANNEDVELVSRSPQELYEITCLIGELMPRLPTDGLFAVDALIERPVPLAQDAVTWQWRDDQELWHPYSSMDSRIIEAAHQAGEDEISLSTLGRTYTIDFHSMQQINEDTGTTKPVHRRVMPVGGLAGLAGGSGSSDVKMEADSDEDKELAAGFIRSLFSVLYEVYSSSAGPAVRYKCLKALLRMVHFASADLLKEVLRNQVVSSHLAGMLASQDLRIVVGALQMAYILMEKLPAEFGVHFRREGVMHQIRHLADTPLPQTPGACSSTNASPAGDKHTPSELQSLVAPNLLESLESDVQPAPSSHIRVLDDVLKRKRASAEGCAGASSSKKPRQEDVASSSTSSVPSSFQSNLPSGYLEVKAFAGNSPSSSNSNRTCTPNSIASSSSNSSPNLFSLESSATPTSHSRFTSSKSSVLASLNPARWGRSSASLGSSASSSTASAFEAAHNGHTSEHRHRESALENLNKSCSDGGSVAGNKEKARTWVKEQAQKFGTLYFDKDESTGALSVLSRLTQAIELLQSQPWHGDVALAELKDIVLTSDISPFEVNHSGLIGALLHYLTFDPNQETHQAPPQSQLQVMQSTSQNNNNNIEVDTSEDSLDQKPHPPRDLKLRVFLNVFASCPKDADWLEMPSLASGSVAAFSALVAKLGGCIAKLEQFPVKVDDLPTGTSGCRTGGTRALKFYNTDQLKCNLQRHPSCNTLKQWKGGTVKIDPLALVQAIERYLVVRGYGRLRDKDTVDSDDEIEEDIDDTLVIVIGQNNSRHKLQFLLGDNPLPYNMTVYQAVRQFSTNSAFGNAQSEIDIVSEVPIGNAGLWVQTHTIYYRPAPEDGPSVPSSSRSGSQPLASTSSAPLYSSHHWKEKSSSKSSSRCKKEISLRAPACPLTSFLQPRLPDNVTISDASLDVLCLLRVMHALSRYWGSLYELPFYKPLLSQHEFASNKISAKASRQLQDPLVIMTGNLPAWLQQLASACPFLFPFEVRQLLFYATSFDRDRALQRLLEASPELNSAEAHERVTPRLDRRKRTVSRSDILRQAEQVVQDLATSRALLEVQYENEVGTGLGPTLEFYALVSRELQRSDLELWLGDNVAGGVDGQTQYIHSSTGLFPLPLSKNAKVVQQARVKAKFRFLGRLMAKAVMDSRMLDMPFSQTLFRILLGEQTMLSLPDLSYVSPAVHSTLARLLPLARQYAAIEKDPSLTPTLKKEAQEKLLFDGYPLSELGLYFTLPGYPSIELKKGGKDATVTIHNVDSYVKLVSHWFLSEGITKQVEALQDGFEAVFPLEHLRLFYPEELEAVFCGAPAGTGAWDMKTLMECCRPDHGYTPDSRAIRFLFEILSSYNQDEQRKFLQFVTGSPRLPVGGFKSLNPPLTVVRKTLEPNMDPDDFLPSVMTCVNYLKLPDYTSVEVMRAKLNMANIEGQNSFLL